MNVISIPGGKLAVYEQGSGPPIVLVHGFPLNHSMWRQQFDFLAASRRVIAPDLRGFGHSSLPGDAHTMAQHADDLAALLDAMNVPEPVVLCGLSMGGYVAFEFWKRHGRRLEKLILCDTRANADDAAAAQNRLEMADRVLKEGTAFVAEAMLPKLLPEETREARAELVADVRAMIENAPPQGVAAAQRGMAQRADFTAELKNIDVPTLVVCGQFDAITPPEVMRGMMEHLPNARYVQIPSAGHLAPWEQPTAVNEALGVFLN